MKFTGERYLPEVDGPEITYEHWHRYLYAAQFTTGKRVLDVASGEGFGSHVLAATAERVIGVDSDLEAVTHASRTYRRSNLTFLCGSAAAIPLAGEHAFDFVVSFETIEHLTERQQERFAAEIKRLLAPDGWCMLSTPDRLQYSDAANYRNPFHVHEFYEHEFVAFLRRFFRFVCLLGQRVYPTSYIWSRDAPPCLTHECQIAFSDGRFQPVHGDQKDLRYVIAVCSDTELVMPGGSVLLDVSERATRFRLQQLEDMERVAQRLRGEIEAKQQEQAALQRAADEQRSRAALAHEQAASRHAATTLRLRRAVVERTDLKRRLAALTKERETLECEVVRLREATQQQAEVEHRLQELAEANEAAERDLSELRGAVAQQADRLAELAGQAERAGRREQALRELLIEAHQQLLRRDVEIEASLGAELRRHTPAAPRAIRQQYLVEQIRAVARASVPANATTLVLSLGDDAFLQLDGCQAWPFPQAIDGTRADYSLANSLAAIEHLEELRRQGAGFLLVPRYAVGWLAAYPEFQQHVERHHRLVVRRPDICTIFALRDETVNAPRRA